MWMESYYEQEHLKFFILCCWNYNEGSENILGWKKNATSLLSQVLIADYTINQFTNQFIIHCAL